jgi:cell division protein FtsW (lipid II flippase)
MAFKLQVPIRPLQRNTQQIRFTLLTAGFLFLYALSIVLAPAVRNHTWAVGLNYVVLMGFALWLVAFLLAQWGLSRLLPNHDFLIPPIVYLLAGWGILTIWRLYPELGIRQNIWLLAGTIGLLIVAWFPRLFELLRKYRAIWMVSALVLVFITVIPGVLEPGSQPSLWLSIGGLSLQPSEPLKFLLIAYLAAYFSDRMTLKAKSWAAILPTLLILGITLLLLVLQRDLGTASLVLVIYTFFIYMIMRKRRVLIAAAVILILRMIRGYLTSDVIRLRVDAWLNPWADPTARSYQIVQSLISIASGGLFGTGPGLGTPGLVPVAVSDFIFTAIMEETGLIGAAGLLVLILVLFSRNIKAIQHADNDFNRLFVAGLSTLCVIQSLLIIGGNIRLFPLTGVTLPYISYGGSSLFINMVIAGIIVRTSNQPRQVPAEDGVEETIRKQVFLVIGAGFALAFLILPIWSIIRKPELTARGDNLRRALNDSFVRRGSIVDRNNHPINQSIGIPGSFERQYLFPNLSSTVGYADPVYGLAGLELEMDEYLRGSTAYPASEIWWNNLLSSQNPPGLDVRLTIDLGIQASLDKALLGRKGAGVVLNANTGEVLAISSVPTFNPSTIASDWNSLVVNPDTPLLNRALHGSYPAGSTTGVFLFAQSLENQINLANLTSDPVSYKGRQFSCAIPTDPVTVTTKEIIQYSCPEANLVIARQIGSDGVINLYKRLGWYQSPSITGIPPASNEPTEIANMKGASMGQEISSVSPLQMAMAAGVISQGGDLEEPKLTLAYKLPNANWSLLPTKGSSGTVFSIRTSTTIQRLTELADMPAWGVVGRGLSGTDRMVTWFIGGTTSEWKGSPISVAFVYEDENSALAFNRGQELLKTILTQ